MNPPTSAYLQALIAAIDGDADVSREIRNECHRLMQAIDANNAHWITESVARIERLAAETSLQLPPRKSKPPRRSTTSVRPPRSAVRRAPSDRPRRHTPTPAARATNAATGARRRTDARTPRACGRALLRQDWGRSSSTCRFVWQDAHHPECEEI